MNHRNLFLNPGTEFKFNLLLMGLVIVYLALSFWNLERFPEIHNDEVGILEPGYNFFHYGVYGSLMYRGFYNQENLYLEVMPLMSWLQGAGAWIWGLGVSQMRMIPVLAGASTLVLTSFLNRALVPDFFPRNHSFVWICILSALLLLVWKWTPGNDPFLGSGIPLIDVSRLARYDILVPPLGLSAFLSWVNARKTEKLHFDLLAGFLAGFAILAQAYGLFWLVSLFALTLLDWAFFSRHKILPTLLAIFGGAFLTLLPWIIVLTSHWSDFLGQMTKHQGKFDLFDPNFYLSNLLNEPHRYHLGVHEPGVFLRLGFWFVILGLPVGTLWLVYIFWKERTRQALWLLIPLIMLPLSFALLIREKRFYYLITYIPLCAILISWALVAMQNSSKRLPRIFAWLIVGVLCFEGGWGIIQMQMRASRETSPQVFFEALRQSVPTTAVVIGPQPFWLALPQPGFRAIVLAAMLSRTEDLQSGPLEVALDTIRPDYVLVTPDWLGWLADTGQPDSPRARFWGFMQAHQARLVQTIVDPQGEPVQIYELDW